MKKMLAFLTAGLMALTVSAKEPTMPSKASLAAPAFSIIAGNPLRINVGADNSYQVFNAAVPGQGQIYPSNANQTADMGWFVRVGGTLYAPNFGEHPGGTATGGLGASVDFAESGLTAVAGVGTLASPFRVTVTNGVGNTGLTATKIITYVNGDGHFTERFQLTNSGAAGVVAATVFLGSDIFLASSDAGIPFREPTSGSPGGTTCQGVVPPYTILHIPVTPAARFTASQFGNVWSQIGSGNLNNQVAGGCIDNGAALQWNVNVQPGSRVTIQAATSFGPVPPITQFNITDVNPPVGQRGTSVPVTIAGYGFLPSNTTFTVTGGDITVNNVAIITSTTATATFVIPPNAAFGYRDVIATQMPGGLVATLIDGFAVGEDPVWEYSILGIGDVNQAAFTCIRSPIFLPANAATNRAGWAPDEGQFYHEDPSNPFGPLRRPVGLARRILDCAVGAWDATLQQLAPLYCWDSPSPQYMGSYPHLREANLRIYFSNNGLCEGPLPGGTIFEQNITMLRQLYFPPPRPAVLPLLADGFE